MLCTPVLFFINHDNHSNQLVFDALKKFNPCKIYFSHISETYNYKEENAENDTQLLINQIDWDCKIRTKYHDKESEIDHDIITKSIDWFFIIEEMGIFLNNDFLPSQSFFHFCEHLLYYYENDSRIMFINSVNYQSTKEIGDGSYYFSKYNQVGTWATWKRTWELIHPNINKLSTAVRLNAFEGYLSNQESDFWIEKIQLKAIDPFMHYNYKTLLSQWLNNGLAITPTITLIKPIEKEHKTRYHAPTSFSYELEKFERIEMKHPSMIVKNYMADNNTFKKLYLLEANIEKIIKLKRKINRFLYLFNKKMPSIVKNNNVLTNNKWQ